LVSALVTTLEVNAAERYCGMLSRGLAFVYAGALVRALIARP
jgi:hypothetical protein